MLPASPTGQIFPDEKAWRLRDKVDSWRLSRADEHLSAEEQGRGRRRGQEGARKKRCKTGAGKRLYRLVGVEEPYLIIKHSHISSTKLKESDKEAHLLI